MKKPGFIFLLPLIFLALSLIFLAFGAGGKAEFGHGALDKPTGFVASPNSQTAKATAYCPTNRGIEGGIKDERSKKLEATTLQAYLAGRAEYVSVAMDLALRKKGYPYGTRLKIPELEQRYNKGKYIEFRLVDNGGWFNGTWAPEGVTPTPKGLTAIDINVTCEHLSSGWSNLDVTLNFEAKKTTQPSNTQRDQPQP